MSSFTLKVQQLKPSGTPWEVPCAWWYLSSCRIVLSLSVICGLGPDGWSAPCFARGIHGICLCRYSIVTYSQLRGFVSVNLLRSGSVNDLHSHSLWTPKMGAKFLTLKSFPLNSDISASVIQSLLTAEGLPRPRFSSKSALEAGSRMILADSFPSFSCAITCQSSSPDAKVAALATLTYILPM